jgi:hypothetical protein
VEARREHLKDDKPKSGDQAQDGRPVRQHEIQHIHRGIPPFFIIINDPIISDLKSKRHG